MVTRRQVVGVVAMIAVLGVAAYTLVRVLSGHGPAGQTTRGAAQPPVSVRVIPVRDTTVSQGIAIAYAVRPAPAQADMTEVSFTLTDAATGQPATPPSPPAVWISAQQAQPGAQGQAALSCQDKVKLFAQGNLDFRAEIDLNAYFILALNNDASISVIDPLSGVTGISQLYAMALLKSPGEDWVMSRDGKRLFVTMPKAGQVAVVDTESFTVLQNIDVGVNPVRIAMQPDGRALWVGNDPTDVASGGVTVIDTAKLAVVAKIPTGVGHHEIAFSGEVADTHPHANLPNPSGKTRYAFVANGRAGSVSVVDTQRLEKVADVNVGASPTSLDYSSASNALYVAVGADGAIVAIDAASHAIVARIGAAPGTQAMRFAPGGRWGFAVSPTSNNVDVIDASTNRIVHSVEVDGAPDKVSFTAAYAYVRASRKPDVALFDLAQVGKPDRLSPVNIIGGQTAPDQSQSPLSVADAIIPIHEHGSHVLIANPADQSIYEYMEGMNAPMGSYQNYSRTPRAVQVVDRSIRETAPGVYAANVKVPRSGQYQVAFLLDSPRIVHCFAFQTEASAAAAGSDGAAALKLQILSPAREATAGGTLALQFALADAQTNAPVADIKDITIIATLASGQRTDRYHAESIGNGVYEAKLTLPAAGVYNLYFTIPSRKVGAGDLAPLTLTVKPRIGSQ